MGMGSAIANFAQQKFAGKILVYWNMKWISFSQQQKMDSAAVCVTPHSSYPVHFVRQTRETERLLKPRPSLVLKR